MWLPLEAPANHRPFQITTSLSLWSNKNIRFNWAYIIRNSIFFCVQKICWVFNCSILKSMGTWVALACYLSFLYNKPYPKKKLFPKVSLLWHTTCQLHCTTTQKWIHIARKICTWRDIANLRKPVNKAIEISISHSHQNLQIWLYTSHRLPGQVPRNFSKPNSQNSVQN